MPMDKTREHRDLAELVLKHVKAIPFDDFGFHSPIARELKRQIILKNFVAAPQCGGFGERFGITEPKPVYDSRYIHQGRLPEDTPANQESLVSLLVGERPLTNLYRDLPREMAIFPHIIRGDYDPFRFILEGFGGYDHLFGFLFQQETQMFTEDGNELVHPANKERITATAGPGTVANCFREYKKLCLPAMPEFCFVIDGSKPAVALIDIINAFERLLDEGTDSVVFSVPERFAGRQKEEDYLGHPDKHPRRAYLNEELQQVQEHPGLVTEEAIRKWVPSAGIYIFRLRRYIEAAEGKRGPLTLLRSSIRGLYTGYGHYLKPTMVLQGYTQKDGSHESGLTFTTYEPMFYIPSLKERGDMDKYLQARDEGRLSFRWWYKKG